uniref:Sex determination protein fox-1 n=1 Tax=Ascaris suum TaxID=6253 RepID=F1LDH8_ASCSU
MTDDASLRLQLQLISPMACFTRHADSPCADVLTMLPSMSMNSSDEAPERLFVGNIPSWFRDSDLRSLFGKYGPITDAHIVLSEQGTAEYGFVTMKNAASVEKARRELHRSWLEGRHLKVKRAVNVTSTGMHSNAPAENRLILAAALEHGAATAAANVDANNAGIAAVDEQYPALPLMGAFHGYQTSSIPHSYVSRFSPY